jgi:hypothetical protein
VTEQRNAGVHLPSHVHGGESGICGPAWPENEATATTLEQMTQAPGRVRVGSRRPIERRAPTGAGGARGGTGGTVGTGGIVHTAGAAATSTTGGTATSGPCSAMVDKKARLCGRDDVGAELANMGYCEICSDAGEARFTARMTGGDGVCRGPCVRVLGVKEDGEAPTLHCLDRCRVHAYLRAPWRRLRPVLGVEWLRAAWQREHGGQHGARDRDRVLRGENGRKHAVQRRHGAGHIGDSTTWTGSCSAMVDQKARLCGLDDVGVEFANMGYCEICSDAREARFIAARRIGRDEIPQGCMTLGDPAADEDGRRRVRGVRVARPDSIPEIDARVRSERMCHALRSETL